MKLHGSENTQGNSSRLNSAELVLRHRAGAFRMARKIALIWNAPFSIDELQSLADLALCEAATRFDPTRDTAFTTYFYYFLKGIMCREMTRQKQWTDALSDSLSGHAPAPDAELQERRQQESAYSLDDSPEHKAIVREFMRRATRAMRKLNPLERRVFVEVDMFGCGVSQLARNLGYSRGHLSMVHNAALRKTRQHLARYIEEVKAA